MTDYEKQYWELRAALNLHDSHSHEHALKYVAVHNDRRAVTQQIINETRSFASKIEALEKRTW